jgi:hypothetical protein
MRQAFSCAIALPTWDSHFRLYFLVDYYLRPTIGAITLLEVIRKLKLGTALWTDSRYQLNHTDKCVQISLIVLQNHGCMNGKKCLKSKNQNQTDYSQTSKTEQKHL